MSTVVDSIDDRRQVKVWLGEHAFIDHIAPNASKGAWFENAMRRQFASCRVTNDPYRATNSVGELASP
ncbi:hypothetical protein AB0F43_31355 [Kribbella sp. NPDC023972]|uniref:hypothetical protein n=1 Tax=Kribbella sp. NPDC023972 TaxID=3154795 RepID=UPI0033D1F02F